MIYLAGIIVFIFYAHTLNYSWKFFDEGLIYNEEILPIPKDFSNYIEIIQNLGLENHFEAGNIFYSDITNIRGTPLDTLFLLTLFLFFKKNIFYYHLFSLLLHVVTTFILSLIVKKVLSFTPCTKATIIRTSEIFKKKSLPKLALTPGSSKRGNFSARLEEVLMPTTLPLIWALHPVNVESILFVTNIGAVITYFFCTLFLYIFINLLDVQEKEIKELSNPQNILIFLFYLFPLFLNEYSVTLPIIVLLLLFSYSRIYLNLSVIESMKLSISRSKPLLMGILTFIIYFLSKLFFYNTNSSTLNIPLILERILWLSPQIFFHFIKLIIYPQNLTLDQTSLVKISSSLFSKYSISCFFIMFLPLALSGIGLFSKRKNINQISLTFLLFFIALLPFLHIISPIYNLSSERYLYLSTLMIIVGISHIIKLEKKYFFIILIFLLSTTTIYSYRSFTRTLDWKNANTLLQSSIDISPNKLYKGLRTLMMAHLIKEKNGKTNEAIKYHTNQALVILKESSNELSQKINIKSPEIIHFYGLDNKTLFAKNIFLIALTESELDKSKFELKKDIMPYLDDLKVYDSQLISFIYPILFLTNDFNNAERFLKRALDSGKYSANLFLALSDFTEYKYKNLILAEEYILKSYKLFPYDPLTLLGLKRIYKIKKDFNKFAYYSYLFELRTHDRDSLLESTTTYIAMKNKIMSEKLLKRLNEEYKYDKNTEYLNNLYQKVFQ